MSRSAELQKHVDEFLASGGRVEEVPTNRWGCTDPNRIFSITAAGQKERKQHYKQTAQFLPGRRA